MCKCKGKCCNGSAPQEVHNDDLAVVEDSGDEDNDEDGHSLSDNDF